MHSIECGGENVPTFRQWIGIYDELSKKRHEQTGMLDRQTTRHILAVLEDFKNVMGFKDDDKVSVINRKSLMAYCDKISGRSVSKKSKCQRIGQAFSRWIRFETEGQWVVPRFDQPEIRDDSERFHEPSQELLVKIAMWYRSLLGVGAGAYKNRDRVYAMMMYKYAMRNGDVNRLKWANFENVNGRYRLVYKPHKTRLSSGRNVKIWLNALDAADLLAFRGVSNDDDFVFGGGANSTLRDRLNKQLRGLGVTGSKALYILRKICIHTVFRKLGREAASSISGDDFDTIKVHYADPDAVQVTALGDEAYC